jgi:tetratricopeptide (TPR) repeat protein
VSSFSRALRHGPFFEALGAMEEGDVDWPATSAGLVTLRLVDAWLDEGPRVAAADGWGVRAVREAIAEIRSQPAQRAILTSIVDAIAERSPAAGVAAPPAPGAPRQDIPRRPGISLIAPRLMAYGRALDFDGKWRLAGDVYRTIVEYADPSVDADVAIDANMRLGYCLRMLGELDGAASAYALAGRIATAGGNLVKMLLAQIGDAKIALARGNFPRADQILERTAAQARASRLDELQGMALMDRSSVAHRRGDFERAVGFSYQALNVLTSPIERDRALADLAASFIKLGVRSAARDALLILAATAQEQFSRWAATINLIDLEVLEGSELRFEQHRRELSDVELPPMVQAEYLLNTGQGYARFGQTELARASLARALEVATAHDYHELAFRAERALRELREGSGDPARGPFPPPALSPSAGVLAIAEKVGEMRQMAGIT